METEEEMDAALPPLVVAPTEPPMVHVPRSSDKSGKESAKASEHSDLALWLIAIFKLFKGVLLLAVGIGALSMLHKDVAAQATHWINLLRADPDNRFLHALIAKCALVNDRKLEEISAGTFFYSALLLTEGIGLSFRKRWAEYFTVITTASLIPLEIYEIVHRISFTKVVVIAVNIAIVWYLIGRLRKRQET
jgi:uncharacterized membrane protein (DUF2068 family)